MPPPLTPAWSRCPCGVNSFPHVCLGRETAPAPLRVAREVMLRSQARFKRGATDVGPAWCETGGGGGACACQSVGDDGEAALTDFSARWLQHHEDGARNALRSSADCDRAVKRLASDAAKLSVLERTRGDVVEWLAIATRRFGWLTLAARGSATRLVDVRRNHARSAYDFTRHSRTSEKTEERALCRRVLDAW